MTIESYNTVGANCVIGKINICDWLWENPAITHKNKYLKMQNSIIQSEDLRRLKITGLQFVINLYVAIQ